MSRPNVIIITPHDLGDFVGCYGHPVSTPHLDRLADQGVLFRNHFSTGTVCSPSRGSITTGCYPHTHGLMGLVHRGWALDVERCPPLARQLLDAGYETYLFGFQHEHYDPHLLGYQHAPPTGGQNVEQVVSTFCDWAHTRRDDGPFLAALGFFDVHRFGGAPSHFRRDAYEPAERDNVQIPPWLPELPGIRDEMADFYGDVSHLDACMGDLFAALDDTGLAENTILVFTSDHGASFIHGKATLYDGGTKVPWIVRWPAGLPAGQVVDSLTSHVDILPTLLDLLQIPIPRHIEGQSMAGLVRGQKETVRPYAFAEKNYTNYYDPSRMVRTRTHKYIRKGLRTCVFDFLIPEIEQAKVNFRTPELFGYYSARRCEHELYDLAQDPGERHNLIDSPKHKEVLSELAGALDAHMEATDDPFRQLENGLRMPENQYEPAMQHMWKRFSHDPVVNRPQVRVGPEDPGSPHPDVLPTEPLWPQSAPGWEDVPDQESTTNREVEQNEMGLNRAISRVSRPSITVYLPPRRQATGEAVLVLPGGGFQHLAIDKEGYDIAQWLRTLGAAAIVVKYRTTIQDRKQAQAAALQDTQRAIRLARSRAAEWHIDPGKIGVIGFSAGGYLVARAATRWDHGRPDATDPVERQSCKPDLLGLLYPAIPEGAETEVTAETPPAFIAQAGDDFLDPITHGLRFYTALHGAKVPAEMLLFEKGGHGFGLGVHGGAPASWPEHFAVWLKKHLSG